MCEAFADGASHQNVDGVNVEQGVRSKGTRSAPESLADEAREGE